MVDKVAHLLGVPSGDLTKNLLKPRIKVGSEYVQQGRTKEQVSNGFIWCNDVGLGQEAYQ